MAQMAERCLDLDDPGGATRQLRLLAAIATAGATHRSPPFSLHFRLWACRRRRRRAGAEIIAFSPLADAAPPESCDSCWLPGGYPELHAGALAAATRFRAGLAAFAKTRPVHGECGGYMVLGEGIEDASGAYHSMTGLLSHATSFAQRKLHLGYRPKRACSPTALGPAGSARAWPRVSLCELD
jgi:cobyrinic acid a,c-diamide synthase